VTETSVTTALGADAIDEQIRRIEAAIVTMAEETGAKTELHLHEEQWERWQHGDVTVAQTVLAVVATLGTKLEVVKVDRHKGRWGLYYWTFRLGAPEAPTVLLRDAPLDVRRRFLDRAEEFCRNYAEQAQELRRVRAAEEAEREAIAAETREKGDRALSALSGHHGLLKS